MSSVFDWNNGEYAREKHLAHLWEFWCQSGWASSASVLQPQQVESVSYRCLLYGYITIDGEKIYTPECLKNEFLVVSNQTAFERDYLIEVVADIYLLQGCFENISKKFNRLKNRQLPTATRERRTELYRKTLTNAFSSTPSLNMVKGMPSKAGKESRAAWRKQWWI